MGTGLLKEPRTLIACVLVTNVCYGLIPLAAVPLFEDWPDVMLLLVLARFTVAGGILACIAAMQFLLARRAGRSEIVRPSFFQATTSDMATYLKSKNKSAHDLPRLAYIAILAFFGVTVNSSTYLVALDQLSIVFVLVVLPGVAMLLVTGYNMATGRERTGLFKGTYVFLMILALGITFLATGEALAFNATLEGILSLMLNVASLFILFVYVGRDGYAPEEKIWKKDPRGNYKLQRTLVKVSTYMLLGGAFTVPVAAAGLAFPGSHLNAISVAFWTYLPRLGEFLLDPRVIALVVACTVAPNLLLFIASTFWDAENSLRLEAWTSTLNLVDPITGTVASVLAGLERVDLVLMTITVIVLAVAILLRLVHERETKINAVIFLKVRLGSKRDVYKFLSMQPDVRKFYVITGAADILIKATFGSVKEFHEFVARVGLHEEIKVKFDMTAFVKDVVA